MARWLAIYSDTRSQLMTAMITGAPEEFESRLSRYDFGLESYPGDGPLVIVTMPDGEFRPDVRDARANAEAPMQFIDL